MSFRELTKVGTVCVLLLLSACGKAVPSGQVVAIANGEEITIAELRAEAADQNVGTADIKASMPELLRQIVNRKLWAQEAKRGELDRQIMFILAKRRAEDRLLADMQMQTVRNAVQPPSNKEIELFLKNNPNVFASRTIFDIDQVSVRPANHPFLEQKLANASSLNEVTRILVDLGIVSQRSRTQWNSMFMPKNLDAKLTRLPPGNIFFQHADDRLIIATVNSIRKNAISQRERFNFARDSIFRENYSTAIAQHLQYLQSSAEIRIQQNF
ncbi:hypothetical protein [Sphingomonas montana]|uniref:hypothetical protein n=1 Tax=Sphingomonas montana TaxID=1843236 RepID=UPI00101AD3D4|nr:hypothetical protein [Sphingomonas montana]